MSMRRCITFLAVISGMLFPSLSTVGVTGAANMQRASLQALQAVPVRSSQDVQVVVSVSDRISRQLLSDR